MPQTPTIIFVCEHGAAKSVIAAAYFNKLVREAKLDLCASARGTHPDAELSSKVIMELQSDGLTVTESVPQKLSLTDVESAQRIIAFCELPAEHRLDTPIDQWGGVPPVNENYVAARDVILERVNRLIAEMK